MPNNFKFIRLEQTLEFHRLQIDAFGGSHGVRVQSLIESALGRAEMKAHHEPDSSAFVLAATYLHALGKNHAFIDGNKRIAFVASVFFLRKNGFKLVASEVVAYETVLKVVTDQMTIEELADWFEANSKPICSDYST